MAKDIFPIQSPIQLYKELKKYVAGQDEAIKKISVAIFSHFIGIKAGLRRPSNILLIGPTGVGKTYVIECLSQIIKIPLYITSATVFSETGYIGEDVENIIKNLFEITADVKKTERGIVFIDEIDKLTVKRTEPETPTEETTHKNPVGLGVQQALLTLLQGKIVNVSKEENKYIFIDTSNILFIGAGTFGKLKDIIRRRLSRRLNPSIVLSSRQIFDELTFDDLLNYGYIPEFIGRFPNIIAFEDLGTNVLEDILLNYPSSPYLYYKELFKAQGKKLIFSQETIKNIIEKAIMKKTGARALASITNKIVEDALFSIEKFGDVVNL